MGRLYQNLRVPVTSALAGVEFFDLTSWIDSWRRYGSPLERQRSSILDSTKYRGCADRESGKDSIDRQDGFEETRQNSLPLDSIREECQGSDNAKHQSHPGLR